MFGAVKLTKNSDIDKYRCNSHGIGFDARGTFSFSGDSFAQNAVIVGAHMSCSVHANNRTKSILVLGQGIIQELDDTTLTAEKMYQVNFSATKRRFCLSLHCNGANSYLLINGIEISVDNMKKTGLYGNVDEFSIDHRTAAVDDVLDIYKYLMKKRGI